jgi:diguanylate cyclase
MCNGGNQEKVMTTQLPDEVIRVHEKSLRLLDESQEQLKQIGEMLRKTVVRLSIAARGEDSQLNGILENIKSTVRNDIDLEQLSVYLDNLLVEINKPESDAGSDLLAGFYSCLEQDLSRFDLSSLPESYRERIRGFVDKKLADHEISQEMLELVNDIATDFGNAESGQELQLSEIKSFDAEVRAALSLGTDVNDDSDVAAILDELADDIAHYAHDHLVTERKNSDKDNLPESIQAVGNINEALIGLLNSVNLPESTRRDHQAICRQLDSQLEGTDQWKMAIENISALINKSISVLQEEKRELQGFIKKITDQLAEIDQYVRQSQQDRIDTVNESSKLKDSVDTNVVAIQESVTVADDISQLKDNVQGHLSEIRKRVEEHQLAETEREEISKQGYAHIISELARTQKETLMLKEQLQESQQKMLRDPLTGLPNRLAYEERIALEVNRSRRNKVPFCLAMWDIDHFKKVNDTYGHDAGDRVLKLLSKIILTRVRKVDMFARIGGEEFVLLMPDTAIEDALNLNNQLRTSLQDSGFHYKGSPCPITSSVGIADFEENDTPETILHKADKALYQSKREGRNRCTVYKL